MSDTWAIETFDLSKTYRHTDAVHRLNLLVRAEGITGFLGRNGAGKSSTIKMLLGITHPSSGRGTVLGRSIMDPQESVEIRRRVAYVAEDKHTYAYMTVRDVIAFTKSFYPDWRSDVEQRLVKQYELPPRRKVRALSKGMRTKLALLLALARRAELLILDEPGEGLDPVSIEELLQTLLTAANDGTAIFFSSHQISEVERVANHVSILEEGRLVLQSSLEDIRHLYRRIALGFPADAPKLEFGNHCIGPIRTNGSHVTVVARNTDAIIQHAYGLGAISAETQPVSLRDVFLDSIGAGT